MAQPGDISLKKIPACQAVRVEYPGYVEDMEAVIETLGALLKWFIFDVLPTPALFLGLSSCTALVPSWKEGRLCVPFSHFCKEPSA